MITVKLTNADPTTTYVTRFKVYDSGTQAGVLTAVSYTPTTKSNALMDGAVVRVRQHGETTLRDTSFRGLWFQPGSVADSPHGFRGCDAEHLDYLAASYTRLNDMLSPNTSSLRAGFRGWEAFKVAVSFSKNTRNAAENETFGFRVTVMGHGSAPDHVGDGSDDGNGPHGNVSDSQNGYDSDHLDAGLTFPGPQD